MTTQLHRSSVLLIASTQCVGFFAFGFSSTLLGPSLNSIIGDLSLKPVLAGLLGSALGIGALSSIVGGSLADRYRRTTVVLASLVLLLAAVLLAGLSLDYCMLFVGLALGGAGLGFYESSSSPLASDIFPGRRSWILNLTHAFQGVGSFIGPVLAGLMLALTRSWRALYLSAAAIVVPTLLLAIIESSKYAQFVDSKRRRHDATSAVSLVKSNIIFVLGFATLFQFAAELGISVWLSSYLQTSKGFDQFWGGITTGLFWGSVAIGRASLGKVIERFGLRVSLVLFPMLGAVLVAAGLVVEQFWIQIALWSVLGLCVATIYPNILAAACLAFPSKEGTACGLTYTIGIIGSITSPVLIGGIAQQYSLGSALIFVLISLVLVAGLAAALSRIKEARVRID